jgi:hypothetical protein
MEEGFFPSQVPYEGFDVEAFDCCLNFYIFGYVGSYALRCTNL